MHLLIPFAAPLDEAGRRALTALALPQLQRLCARRGGQEFDEGDEWSFSAPHERVLARALGWQGGDGRWPWAARAARADGVEAGGRALGLVTPVHWHLGTDQVSLVDPAALMLDERDAHALFESVRDHVQADGYDLHFGAASRWYLAHPSLEGLATASLDRVIGRNVDRWLGVDPAARLVRRLQSEVQMLLHTHPVNAAREARGLLPVNSFWLSGCGVAQPEAGPAPPVDERLRAGALAGDWAAWAKAWESLDEGPLAALADAAARGEPFTLTLCGERRAISLRGPTRGLMATLRARLMPTAWPSLVEAL